MHQHQVLFWPHQPVQHLLPVGLCLLPGPGLPILRAAMPLALPGGRPHELSCDRPSGWDLLKVSCKKYLWVFFKTGLWMITNRSLLSSWICLWSRFTTSLTNTPFTSSSVSFSISSSQWLWWDSIQLISYPHLFFLRLGLHTSSFTTNTLIMASTFTSITGLNAEICYLASTSQLHREATISCFIVSNFINK